MDSIVNKMGRLSINTLGVCEVKWPGAGKVVSNGVMFLYSGRTDNKHMHGIVVFLDQDKASCVSLTEYCCYDLEVSRLIQ